MAAVVVGAAVVVVAVAVVAAEWVAADLEVEHVWEEADSAGVECGWEAGVDG